MRPFAFLLVAMIVVPPTASALPGEETPTDGVCDATGLLLCAGANAGADVDCGWLAAGVASCAYTWGNLWTAYSPVGLPGDATVTASHAVSVCVGGSCSITDVPAPDASCAWVVGPVGCSGADRGEGATAPVALAMGQCLLVTVTSDVLVEARASILRPVQELAFENAGEGAGQVCLVDDGR